MAAKLSILTATWNRRDLLPRLYASLEAQTGYHDAFEWVVVDDGSTDETALYLAEIAQKAPFGLHVLHQENGGKHRALNRGLQAVRTPWLLIVDSDDWLLNHGIANALEDIRTLAVTPEVTSIIAPLQIRGVTPSPPRQSTEILNYCRFISVSDTDKSCLMRSELLRKFPFPSFNSENFIAESSVWARAFKNGGIRLSNSIVVAAEYQPEGLSDRSLALRMKNPLGCLYTYSAQLDAGVKGRRRVRALANYHRFFWHGWLGGKVPGKHGFRPNPLWLALTAPLAVRDCLKNATSRK